MKIDISSKRLPVITLILIVVCCTVFFLQGKGIYHVGLVPLDFIYGVLHPGPNLFDAIQILFISFFMHGSIMHLLSNMWYLWLFGSALENHIGKSSFIVIYILCGVLSMLVQISSSPFSRIPVIGASGAIAGIMGLGLVCIPFSRMVVWFPPLFFFRIPSFFFLLLWFYIQYTQLKIPQGSGGGVAWWAHAGGFVAGLACAVYLKVQGKKAKAGSNRRKQK